MAFLDLVIKKAYKFVKFYDITISYKLMYAALDAMDLLEIYIKKTM